MAGIGLYYFNYVVSLLAGLLILIYLAYKGRNIFSLCFPLKFKPYKDSLLSRAANSFGPWLLILFVVKGFVYDVYFIPSASMVPSLRVGDYILVDKFSYGLRFPVFGFMVAENSSPKSGDVVVFHPPINTSIVNVKRVIGIAGDRVSYKDNELFINGISVRTPNSSTAYPNVNSTSISIEVIGKTTYPALDKKDAVSNGEWVVPEGKYFMMGDNRGQSADSREWGFVDKSAILGKPIIVLMNWDRFLSIPNFSVATRIQ